MFNDTWDEQGNRTRSGLLADFNQSPDLKMFNRLRVVRQDQPSQSEAIIRIERFVDFVINHKGPAYKFNGRGSTSLSETRIGRRLRKAFPLHFLFGSMHSYSGKPAVFLRACWQVLRMYGFGMKKAVRSRHDVDMKYAEVMNLIVETIRKLAGEDWFMRAESDRRYQSSQNGLKAAQYVAAVLNHYARTEVVRLDFGYVGGASAMVTIDRAWADLGDFLQLLDWHPYFEHMTGYMWSIEQGEDKGFHMHLVFFFNGSEVCRDIVKGNLIGQELWVDRITLGRGTYYNCNMHKDRYVDTVGIGTINRHDSKKCMNAIRCLQYLPKGGEFLGRDDQYLRIKHKDRMHTFGTGQLPVVEETRRGRPAAPATWFNEGNIVDGS